MVGVKKNECKLELKARTDAFLLVLLLNMPSGRQANVHLEGIVDTPLEAREGTWQMGQKHLYRVWRRLDIG